MELLLYVGIASAVLLSTSLFLATLLEARVKNQVITEVEEQGAQAMEVMTQAARNAEAVNAPAPAGSAASLSLNVVTVANDPTVFDLSSGVLRMTEGAGSAVALTNDRVVVSSLAFQNLSRSDTPGTVQIQFTLTHINPEGRGEFAFQKTFIGSATLRQP